MRRLLNVKPDTQKSLLVIAGELSGDMHAAGVVRVLKAEHPDLPVYGIGGDRLRGVGMEIAVEARDMAVLGFWEVLKRYRFLRGVFNRMIRLAEERRPDAVLLVDYPGFNLRFAREMKKRGIRVVYYICPQVWAWHQSRIPVMARILDRLMVIFPFEVEVFAGTALKVDYVGHPLVDEARAELASAVESSLPWRSDLRLALLPGSRRQEIDRILPGLVQAAGLLQQRLPSLSTLIAAASPEIAELIRARLREITGGPTALEVVVGSTRRILREATAAIVKSGTSTIEAALMRCPMIVVYRTTALSYWVGKRLIRVPYLGMVNLIAKREAFREFIQDAATPDAMAEAMVPLLTDTPERAASLASADEVTQKLGEGGAATRAAQLVWQELSSP